MQPDINKQVEKLKRDTQPAVLAPKILDSLILNRADPSTYITGGSMEGADLMLEIVWQGRRYRIAAYEV